MISRFNKLSLAIGAPGIIMAHLGLLLFGIDGLRNLGVLSFLSGFVLLFIGVLFYVKAKGRHWAWTLVVFLDLIGLVILYFLEDYMTDD